MNAKEIKGMRCPHCEEVIVLEDLPVFPVYKEEDLDSFFNCSECRTIHETEEEANTCCKD